MGKHLENILGKGIAGNGGKADWKRKKIDIVNTTYEECYENVKQVWFSCFGTQISAACFILEGTN